MTLQRVHHAAMTMDDVSQVTQRLLTSSRQQRAEIGSLQPGRADIIAGGALIVQQIMQAAGASQLIASEHDILDGIAYALG